MKTLLIFLMSFFSVVLFSTEKSNLQFGSYGRIGIASNLDGGAGTQTNIVSHSTRIEKDPYQELYIKYDFTSAESKKDDLAVKLNFTMAFSENLFHYNGQFKMETAVRDFFIDIDNALIKNLNLWVGSRMYRGDDIYLLDFWPLDNLNTVGFGLKYSLNSTEFKLHLGANQLDQGNAKDPYFLKYYTIPLRDKVGTKNILILDRQRYISSLGVTHLFKDLKLKLKFYGEFHAISEASYNHLEKDYALPSDMGYLVGFQTTYYGFANSDKNFVHLFVKYAMNMAAYGDLGIPYDLNKSHKTTGAREFLAGLALNFEMNDFGVILGSYFRNFKDADESDFDNDDISEAVVDARFLYYIGNYFHISTELSYQMLKSNNLDSLSLKQETPQLFKFILMPTLSPNGRGNMTQPKIRLVYSFSMYNDSAQKIINYEAPSTASNPDGSWSNRSHYLGISAEWWFNN